MGKLRDTKEKYIKKTEGKNVEDILEQRMDAQIEFYENALYKKEKITVAFNKLEEDGTLVCISDTGIQIKLPADKNRNDQTFIGRMKEPYKVIVKEVDIKRNEVIVGIAVEFSDDERLEIIKEIKQIYDQLANEIKLDSADEIKDAQERAFEKYCTELDMNNEQDATKIEKILQAAEDRAIGDILEKRIGDVHFKSETGEKLTEKEQLYNDLVIPAKIFAKRPKGIDQVQAAVNLLGMHIDGRIMPKHWMDRHSDKDLYTSELNMLIGSTIMIAVIGYNRKKGEFICSRRAIQASIWNEIENYFSVGDIVQIRCVNMMSNRFYGRVVGMAGANGDGRRYDEFQKVNIVCFYPNSIQAINHNVQIQPGGIYFGKIHKIDKEKRLIVARAFREAGRWAQEPKS